MLRKLNSFHVCEIIMCRFYQSFIESLLTYSFLCWFKIITVKDRKCIEAIVNICSKIIGVKQRDLTSMWEKQVAQKARRIVSQPEHILAVDFDLLPSGWRYRLPSQSNSFGRSFISLAVSILNTVGSNQ